MTERRANDAYYTPDSLAQACVGLLADEADEVERAGASSWVCEPSVGRGAFARAARAAWPLARIVGVDVDPGASCEGLDGLVCADWLDCKGARKFNVILGNPPYGQAQEHVEHALSRLQPWGWAAFLLRLAFLESAKRSDFWQRGELFSVHVLASRPSFTEDGRTDGAAYGWFMWMKGWDGSAVVHPCWDWRK